ncbi:MAG: ABC transporter ATP-binding protein [Bacteroidota bacterium]
MTRPILQLTGVSKSFGGVRVVRDVDLTVAPGERRLILGPNGAGKTTLFNLITGDVACDHGSIALNDAQLAHLPTARRVRAGLSRTYQILSLFPHDSLRQNVVLALLGLSRSRWNPFDVLAARRDLRDEADRILATVRLDAIAERPVAQCAYGEKRRLEIALALAQRPKVLLLDEPLAGLSQAERADTRRLLGSIPTSVTVLLIEHDMDVALTLAERVTVLHLGEVIADGERDAVIRDPRVREVYLGE